MRPIMLCAAFELFGCGVHAVQVLAPEGVPAWEIWCRGNIPGCIEEAKERCPGGYDVLPSTAGDILTVRCRERAWKDYQ